MTGLHASTCIPDPTSGWDIDIRNNCSTFWGRRQEEGVNITVNALHPGVISTNLARHSTFMTVCIHGVFGAIQKNIPQGASTTCFVALSPKVKGVSGEYFADNNVAKPSAAARDPELAKKLWECGTKLTTSK